MVTDFEEGRILGELQELEDEIEAVTKTYYIMETLKSPQFAEGYDKIQTALYRTLARLQDLKQHKEMRLIHHRQRVKESGIKY